MPGKNKARPGKMVYFTRNLDVALHDRLWIYSIHWDISVEETLNHALRLGLEELDKKVTANVRWKPEKEVQ